MLIITVCLLSHTTSRLSACEMDARQDPIALRCGPLDEGIVILKVDPGFQFSVALSFIVRRSPAHLRLEKGPR